MYDEVEIMSIKSKIKPFIPVELQALRRRIIKDSYEKKQIKNFKKAASEYLAAHKVSKLQLGSRGNTLKEWLNTDLAVDENIGVYYLDVTKNFPIPDESFDYVYCEELIEHIEYQEGLHLLSECFRILKPGGKMRIGTPDLKSFIELYNSKNNKLHREYTRWIVDNFFSDIKSYSSVFVINNLFRNWGHKFIYDFDTLADSFQRAGFINIVRMFEGKSDDKNLMNIEQHGLKDIGQKDKLSENKKFRNFESFFAEAQKPLK
jgi:predicted SAM-dependent methyltransferase